MHHCNQRVLCAAVVLLTSGHSLQPCRAQVWDETLQQKVTLDTKSTPPDEALLGLARREAQPDRRLDSMEEHRRHGSGGLERLRGWRYGGRLPAGPE
jgi:hypothetical protein